MNENGELAREEAWAMVALLVGLGVVGVLGGYLLDSRLGTQPWLLLSGAVLGLGAGLFLALRSAIVFSKRQRHGP
ncbi:MAG TPA: AtpZ/AtpI family protein [Myxococcales bacterium]|jgi:F0F1-type ATP synthase assembly protein I